MAQYYIGGFPSTCTAYTMTGFSYEENGESETEYEGARKDKIKSDIKNNIQETVLHQKRNNSAFATSTLLLSVTTATQFLPNEVLEEIGFVKMVTTKPHSSRHRDTGDLVTWTISMPAIFKWAEEYKKEVVQEGTRRFGSGNNPTAPQAVPQFPRATMDTLRNWEVFNGRFSNVRAADNRELIPLAALLEYYGVNNVTREVRDRIRSSETWGELVERIRSAQDRL